MPGLAFAYLDEKDVVRHELVQRIIKAYEQHAAQGAGGQGNAERETEAPAAAGPGDGVSA